MNEIKFNEAQQQVIDTTEGTVLVISCPGSGKTTVLIHRIKKLIENGVNPNRILVTTFTVAATADMMSRLQNIGIHFPVRTIHSLAYHIAKRNKSDLSVISEDQKVMFFQQYIHANYKDSLAKSSELDNVIREIIGLISYAKNTDSDPTKNKPELCEQEEYIDCYYAYEDSKNKNNKVDFDDCLIQARNILRTDQEALAYWQNQFDYIMVDEYQDTNRLQAEIFTLLAKEHRNLCVVGDDDQAMYSFRGADSSIMLDFEKMMQPCTKIVMDTNYRSKPEIVKRADALIKHNKSRFEKKLKAARSGEAIVQKVITEDSIAQAKNIVDKIKEAHKSGVPYEEMAILYRTNAQSAALVLEIMKQNLPFHTNDAIKDPHSSIMFADIKRYYQIVSGKGTSKDFLGVCNRPSRYLSNKVFLGVACNEGEQLLACSKANNPNFARKNIEKFWNDIESLKAANTPAEFMRYLDRLIGYGDSLSGIAKFSNQDPRVLDIQYSFLLEESSKYDTMEEWFADADDMKNKLKTQKKNIEKSGVCLSTYHQAKGLEWDTVFLADCLQGLTPHKNAKTDAELEEERRMFYVAFTRAKNAVYAYVSDRYGRGSAVESMYLDELQMNNPDFWTKDKNQENTEKETGISKEIIYLKEYFNKKDKISADELRGIMDLCAMVCQKEVG